MFRLPLSLGLSCLLLCSAASADELFSTPRPSAYLDFRFGSERPTANAVQLGLALRAEGANADAPPLMQLDFGSAGALLARLGGVPLQSRERQLNQAEGETMVAETGEQGLLSQAGDFFQGLGVGTGTVLIAGGVAVALMVASSGGSDGSPGPGGNDNDNPDNGGTICTGQACIPFPNPGCIGMGTNCTPGPLFTVTSGSSPIRDNINSHVEHALWLESDSGHMGDLLITD